MSLINYALVHLAGINRLIGWIVNGSSQNTHDRSILNAVERASRWYRYRFGVMSCRQQCWCELDATDDRKYMENISKSSNIEATRTHSVELDSCVVYNSGSVANDEVIKVFFFSAISLLFLARQHIFRFLFPPKPPSPPHTHTHKHLTHNRKSIYQINEKMVGHSLLLAKVRLSPILIASLSEIYQNTSKTMCACNGESRMDDNGIRLHFNQFHSRVRFANG